jgi:IS30 family transposase
MFSIQGFLTWQSKLLMTYKHISQAERYQIHALMKAEHNQSQIAKVLERSKSTISRELSRNTGSLGYWPKQACEMSADRAQNSRNANTVPAWVNDQAQLLLQMQWSPEQIASKLTPSAMRRFTCVFMPTKLKAGRFGRTCAVRSKRKKRYAGGQDRRGQIPNRRPISERPLHIEARKQVGHWECDTVIGASHKGADVTMVERKSGYAEMAKVSNKTSAAISSAIVGKLQPLAARVERDPEIRTGR